MGNRKAERGTWKREGEGNRGARAAPLMLRMSGGFHLNDKLSRRHSFYARTPTGRHLPERYSPLRGYTAEEFVHFRAYLPRLSLDNTRCSESEPRTGFGRTPYTLKSLIRRARQERDDSGTKRWSRALYFCLVLFWLFLASSTRMIPIWNAFESSQWRNGRAVYDGFVCVCVCLYYF